MRARDQLLIAGRWTGGDDEFTVFNKYTGVPITTISACSPRLVNEAISHLSAAFEKTRFGVGDRARVLARTADILEVTRQSFVDVLVAETGFTVAEASNDFARTVVTLRLCAEEATRLTGETVSFASSGQEGRLGFTLRSPLGIIAAITPFNSPLNTVAHKIGPAIAAGNVVALKPSNLTPLSALLLVEALLDAGLPPVLLALLNGDGSSIGQSLVANPSIAFYAFTGSTAVGESILRQAGTRRCQMELGSISSTLVCKDADLDRAVPKILQAAFRKAGQVCTSTQRVYVDTEILRDVTDALVKGAESVVPGDPSVSTTGMGPMVSSLAADRVMQWLALAQKDGAQVLSGGQRQQPSLVAPTVVENAPKGSAIRDEEVFGPTVCIIPFSDIREAIRDANDTKYGLSVGIFTQKVDVALSAAKELRFGSVHINAASSARADEMPFGGTKASGFGREGPKYAVREMSEERLVTFNP